MLKVGIVGLGGRMGHALWDCCLGLDGAKVVCGIDKSTDTLPSGCNVEVVDEPSKLSAAPDMFIDFSRPECSLNILEYAKQHNCKVILGTTGFSAIRLRNTQSIFLSFLLLTSLLVLTFY